MPRAATGPVKPVPPFIPGHEGIGLVVAMGAGVTIVKEGDRVGGALALFGVRALRILPVRLGNGLRRCPVRRLYQEWRLRRIHPGRPNYVAHIPAGLAAKEAAPIICAGITTYKGIKETEARPGEWVAISGVGGLGHLAIQYAKAMGLKVCAVDIDDGKLAHAKRLGADLVFNAKDRRSAEALKKETGGGAHGVLITAPSLPAFKQGVAMTRKRGTCVLSGCRRANSRCRCSMWWRIA